MISCFSLKNTQVQTWLLESLSVNQANTKTNSLSCKITLYCCSHISSTVFARLIWIKMTSWDSTPRCIGCVGARSIRTTTPVTCCRASGVPKWFMLPGQPSARWCTSSPGTLEEWPLDGKNPTSPGISPTSSCSRRGASCSGRWRTAPCWRWPSWETWSWSGSSCRTAGWEPSPTTSCWTWLSPMSPWPPLTL